MNFTSLASSSAGNAYIVDDGKTRLLIECGIPYRRLQKLTGFGTAGIQGCLLSHEHKDHSKCCMDLVKNGLAVYASEGTVEALGVQSVEQLPYDGQGRYRSFAIGSFDVLPFPTFHDAAEPVGFLIRSRTDGERLMFATDTVNLAYEFHGLTLVALECNYQEEILARAVKMPEKVRQRIGNCHMDIGRACTYLRALDLSQCRRVYLLHLSDACSNEKNFVAMAERACRGVEVVACPKEGGKDCIPKYMTASGPC